MEAKHYWKEAEQVFNVFTTVAGKRVYLGRARDKATADRMVDELAGIAQDDQAAINEFRKRWKLRTNKPRGVATGERKERQIRQLEAYGEVGQLVAVAMNADEAAIAASREAERHSTLAQTAYKRAIQAWDDVAESLKKAGASLDSGLGESKLGFLLEHELRGRND